MMHCYTETDGYYHAKCGEDVPLIELALVEERVTCPKCRLKMAESLLSAASSALKSYQYGNSSPDLAKEICEKIDGFLEKKNVSR